MVMTGKTRLAEGTLHVAPSGMTLAAAEPSTSIPRSAGKPTTNSLLDANAPPTPEFPSPQLGVSEQELLDRIRAGDVGAFDALFRQWYPAVVRVAERIVGETALAEELAQEVFLGLWRRRESLDANGTPQSYLFQAVRNRALNYLRHAAVERKGAVVIPLMIEPAPTADAEIGAQDLAQAINSAIAALPPRCREVFQMSRERGLRYTEIAETLGITVKAVEANMGRALKLLRLRLAPWIEQIQGTNRTM
jgi:RNA polymerase sigma-70 factor (ECF subfamily)